MLGYVKSMKMAVIIVQAIAVSLASWVMVVMGVADMTNETIVYDVMMTDNADGTQIPYALFLIRKAAEAFIEKEKGQYSSHISFEIESRILYQE